VEAIGGVWREVAWLKGFPVSSASQTARSRDAVFGRARPGLVPKGLDRLRERDVGEGQKPQAKRMVSALPPGHHGDDSAE
jgi:hypothetical protein